MASSPFFNHTNQVSGSASSKIHHGRSKAQMCLKKIIDIISSRSSLQPCEISKRSSLNPQFDGLESEAKGSRDKSTTLFPGKGGFDIDLNLRLGPPPESKESENQPQIVGFSAGSAVGEADGKVCNLIVDCNSSVAYDDVSTVEKSSEGECDPKEVGNSSGSDFPTIQANIDGDDEPEVVEEERREFSEITNLQVRSSWEIDDKRASEETDGEESEIRAVVEEEEHQQQQEPEDKGVEEKKLFCRRDDKGQGYLGLLVEAARLISGNFGDDESESEKPSRSGGLREEATGEESQKGKETETETNESKRNQSWMFELYGGFEDISPVVRSKRGRNQVLPYRYRDSVLEPWKRLSRQRSTRVSKKPKAS